MAASMNDSDATAAGLSAMTEEVQSLVLTFLTGWEAAGASAAFRPWHEMLQSSTWWSGRCAAEFRTAVPRCLADPAACCEKYRELLGAAQAKVGAWCHRSSRHGLGKRVAQPQLFVGPRGERLFSYGGWTDRGPANDLHSVPLAELVEAARAGREEGLRFQEARTSGSPVAVAGVQTLTPLWYGDLPGDRPSEALLAQVVAELRGGDRAGAAPDGLLLAFGGALGNYCNESRDWAVGVLHEGSAGSTSRVDWVKPRKTPGLPVDLALPTPRGAHTATFVPPRLVNAAEFPEGCVVVFGGHTNDCTEELDTLDVFALHSWQWLPGGLQATGVAPAARHGHSASLIEVDGRGFLLIAGGGTGNILRRGQEFSDAAVLDLASWCWVGSLQLSCGGGVPAPGRHHTASLGLCGQIFIFGGGDEPDNKMCVLDGAECVRRACAATAELTDSQMAPPLLRVVPEPSVGSGGGEEQRQPRGRKMHGAACLLPFAPYCVVFGGWKSGPHFNDLWVLRLAGGGDMTQHMLEPDPRGGERSDSDEGLEFERQVGIVGANGRLLRIPSRLLARMLQEGMLQSAPGTSVE